MEAPPLRYAADGRLVGKIGSVGDGPLEYRYLEALTHAPGDSLWLSNASGRIVIIAPDGNVVRQIRTGGQDIDAFDPRGYSAELSYRRAADRVTWVSATVWSPSGDSVSVLGPGGAPENVHLHSVGSQAQYVALIDSTRALVGWPGSGSGMMEGLLWVTDLNGELVAASSIDGNPRGFADPSHYYTMDEQPSGLVVINVWHYQIRVRGMT